MMHQIRHEGKIFRSWTGDCPGVEVEYEKALQAIDGYTYHEVAFAEYAEGDLETDWDFETGICLKAPVETPVIVESPTVTVADLEAELKALSAKLAKLKEQSEVSSE